MKRLHIVYDPLSLKIQILFYINTEHTDFVKKSSVPTNHRVFQHEG